MPVTELPSGRFRVRVWSARENRYVPAAEPLGLPKGTTWPNRRAGRAAERDAEKALKGNGTTITVRAFWTTWTTDPLFARPKESTNVHNRERTIAFVECYGDLTLAQVSDFIVAQWLAGGGRNGTVPALRAMFNDAASAKAGRLVATNPFADLGIPKTRGNRDKTPPSQDQMENMVIVARQITPPAFAAYLEFACCTAARPSELDALRLEWVDFDSNEVHLKEQWNAKVRKFTPPKYGPYTITLVDRARDILLGMKRAETPSPFVFVTNRGTHFTPPSRTHHWNRVRCAIGLPDMTLYVATRHYFGWYATNVLRIPSEVLAVQFGHKDGGKLIRDLYGHADKDISREAIRTAYNQAGRKSPLKLIRGELA
jgi:integrase